MICFGIKTDQEVKENVTCGSHTNLKKKNKKKGRDRRSADVHLIFFIYIIFFSHFSLRFAEIGQSEFVGARTKRLYLTRATHGNQKHGISPSFQLKVGKSSVLVFLRSTAF